MLFVQLVPRFTIGSIAFFCKPFYFRIKLLLADLSRLLNTFNFLGRRHFDKISLALF